MSLNWLRDHERVLCRFPEVTQCVRYGLDKSRLDESIRAASQGSLLTRIDTSSGSLNQVYLIIEKGPPSKDEADYMNRDVVRTLRNRAELLR
jgi:hypothetical protein